MGLLNLTAYKPVSGTSGDANQISNGFTAIETVVNALTNANVDAAASIDVSKLAAGSSGQVILTTGGVVGWGSANAIPAGVVTQYIAAAAPTGWLLCDGTAVSRTTYAALFAIVSTTYGVGDGSTTFNVPDMRGRVPVGLGTNASVNALNTNDGQSVANRRPHHRTTYNGNPALSFTNGSDTNADPTSSGSGQDRHFAGGVVIGTGNANDYVDSPSFIVVNYIIKT